MEAEPIVPLESAEGAVIPYPRRWLALPIVIAGFLLGGIDFFVVNVSIPSLQSDLHVSDAAIQLIVAGYSMASAVLVITGGRLGDIYGRKRMFIAAMSGFTLASTFCGLAPNAETLVAARLLQGATAAMLTPQVLATLQVMFPPHERNLAFGIYGTAAGFSSAIGLVLGGLLLKANLFGLLWRPVFLINVPIGIVTVIAAARIVPESRSSSARRLDLVGVLLVSVALFLLVYPLAEGRQAGWPPWAFAMLAAFVPVLLVFLAQQQRKLHRGGSPLIDLVLFREPSFALGLITCIVFFGGQASFFLTFTLYLQDGLHFSALPAGLSVTPFGVGIVTGALSSVRLVRSFGSRALSVGAVVMGSGIVGIILIVRAQGGALQGYQLAPALLLYGFGQGCVTSPLANVALRAVHESYAGMASGIWSTTQQVASSLGVVLIGIVFFGVLGSNPVENTYIDAFAVSLIVNLVLILVTFFLAFALPDVRGVRVSHRGIRVPVPAPSDVELPVVDADG